MKISRRFTSQDRDVYDSVEWTTRTSRITNADGSVVFEMNDAEIPASWSQLATDIVVSKYFRKAGVPQVAADGSPITDEHGNPVLGPERSVRQVVSRLSRCWRHWGESHGYFSTTVDADAFEAEIAHMLLNQMAAPNSPQWFNTGLNLAYGITGPAQGHFIPDHATGEVTLASDAYTHPQPHACFIQSVSDDLVGDGGIMDLWTREARLFKYGSGTGTNFSVHPGFEDEPLSGGGRSSGLMSFLKIGDRAAGAIKSGGTTRRAAKMVCLDLDHPDIEEFIDWKVREEIKVAALVEGMKHLAPDQKEVARRSRTRPQLRLQRRGVLHGQRPELEQQRPDLGRRSSTRSTRRGTDWNLVRRTDGENARAIPATGLWEKICFAAWKCADPGVQYDSTINAWHTCPEEGRINASNPCSEYMFLDDTACNLASINLLKFFDAKTTDLRHRRVRARHRSLDHRARDLGADGEFPLRGDRSTELEVPNPGTRLCEPRCDADAVGHPLRQRRRPCDLRSPDLDPHGSELYRQCPARRGTRPLRRVRVEPREHAPGHPEPPSCGPRRRQGRWRVRRSSDLSGPHRSRDHAGRRTSPTPKRSLKHSTQRLG